MSPSPADRVTLDLFESAPEQLHISFVYFYDALSYRCHLGWHLDFENLPYNHPTRGLREKISFADTDNERIMSTYLSTIKEEEGQLIPYGFFTSKICFGKDGLFLGLDSGEGLTCASFVIAVFEALSLPLIDRDTWIKRAEDREWQQNIANILKRQGHAQRYEEIKADIGVVVRFKPCEVFGAGCRTPEKDRPLAYSDAIILAQQIRDQLGM